MAFFTIAKSLFTTLLKGPATEKYPLVPRSYCRGSRGSIKIEITDCIFCGMCQRKCPTEAIVVTKTERKWVIDRMRCVSCNACVEVCPKKCLYMHTEYTPPSFERRKDTYQDA